ncbi:hypothetical protein J5N97_001890 [Dioscorea zingiberensis]|uniref:Uncharacterized protein n=1 Tax=Dioscorea zingiberensis TaxID=325984 RepID=A0A9D5BTJ8_9LILI|nr:hypothetical protein J5N97_001890 [Dioscorea zingiberensis]
MAAYYFGEMSYVKPPAEEVLKRLFIPKLKGNGATVDVIALMDALVMLKTPCSTSGINDACKYFLLKSGFALFITLLINIAIVSVSGTVLSRRPFLILI